MAEFESIRERLEAIGQSGALRGWELFWNEDGPEVTIRLLELRERQVKLIAKWQPRLLAFAHEQRAKSPLPSYQSDLERAQANVYRELMEKRKHHFNTSHSSTRFSMLVFTSDHVGLRPLQEMLAVNGDVYPTILLSEFEYFSEHLYHEETSIFEHCQQNDWSCRPATREQILDELAEHEILDHYIFRNLYQGRASSSWEETLWEWTGTELRFVRETLRMQTS